MEKWRGKIAVVTGANSGIGKAIAITLLENGLIVVGIDINEENMKKNAEKYSDKFFGLICDIRDENSVKSTFDNIEKKFGGVDLLVNNAAVLNYSAVTDGDLTQSKIIFDTNVLGTTLCTREALKTMRKRGDNGQIIFINSVSGKIVSPVIKKNDLGMYPASKFYENASSQTLRLELRSRGSLIRITNIYPGLVYTNTVVCSIAKEMDSQDQDKELDDVPEVYLSTQYIADVAVDALRSDSRAEIQEIVIPSPVNLFYG